MPWHFAEQRLDDVDDETTVSKNFARESRKLAGVFVREFFQNVLDARVDDGAGGKRAPHVRITILKPAGGLNTKPLGALLAGLEKHLLAAGHDQALWADDRLNVLVLEELGTSGLIGDTANSRAKGSDQRWANFWFGEGKRTKRGASLGRAGQGKITYHLISGAQSIFAITRQSGASSDLLFGKSIVQRTHELGGQHYKRHGYWPVLGTGDQPLPCTDGSVITEFKKDFRLTRNDETGTSWVIPYVDAEFFSKELLIGEILRDFFFSIMAGALTVEVMGTAITQANIAKVIAEHPIKDLPGDFVSFLEEAVTLPETDPTMINVGPDWYGPGSESPMLEAAVGEEALVKAREVLDKGGLVAMRLPIAIRPIDRDPVEAKITVFLRRPEQLARTQEIYVRSGLVIGEELHLRDAPGRYFGLMLANDPEISAFLGYAEEASHMKWNARESEVTSRYKTVDKTIASVRHSLPKLAKLLLGQASGRHDDALIDFLSIPAPAKGGAKAKSTKRKGKTGTEKGGGTYEGSPQRFRVSQEAGQWALKPGLGAATLTYPMQLRIDLAYATMPGEGNPFKVYHRFEFDLADDAAHEIKLQNATVNARDLNRLEVELGGPDFAISVLGFSEHALKSRIVSVET